MKKISDDILLKTKLLRIDIIVFLFKIFSQTNKKYVIYKIYEFYKLFLHEYPLKYQQNDKFIITKNDLLKEIKEMNICSKFKFKRKIPKSYKFVRRKVNNARHLLF